MLNVLRESFKQGTVLKAVLIAVGVGLVAFLGNYFVGGGGGSNTTAWVARVNGTAIPEWRFREVARNLDEYYRGMFGQNYDQIKPQLQIRRQALETLIDKELVRQDARKIGLEASRSEIAEQIRTHPSLQDASGQFIGKDRYLQVLERNYPGGHGAFERQLAEDLLESKWASLVTQPVTVTDEDLEQTFRQRTEKTAIDYVVFSSTDQRLDGDPDDAELRRWYDEHLEDFQREAGRNIRYVVIDRDSQMEAIEIPADEIQTYYETNQASYSHPEQRRARHILLRVDSPDAKETVRAQAEEVLQRLQAGEDFARLAEELSQDTVSAARGGDLDYFGRGQMLEAFEEAAFGTPEGQLAPITETLHGFHIIEVTDSRPAGVAPIEDVREDIVRLLRFRAVDSRLQEEADRLREAIGSADALEQVAASRGLEVQSAFFNESERIPTLGPSPSFTTTVSQLEPGTLSTPLRVAAGVALVVVDAVLPPAPTPFDEVKERVSSEVRRSKARTAATRAARESHEKHADVASLAKAAGKELQSSDDLGPGQAPSGIGGSSPELTEALFGDGVQVGDRGVVEVPAGAIVYEVSRREPYDATRFEEQKNTLRREVLQNRREQYRQSIVNQLRSRQEVEYNPLWLASFDEEG